MPTSGGGGALLELLRADHVLEAHVAGRRVAPLEVGVVRRRRRRAPGRRRVQPPRDGRQPRLRPAGAAPEEEKLSLPLLSLVAAALVEWWERRGCE